MLVRDTQVGGGGSSKSSGNVFTKLLDTLKSAAQTAAAKTNGSYGASRIAANNAKTTTTSAPKTTTSSMAGNSMSAALSNASKKTTTPTLPKTSSIYNTAGLGTGTGKSVNVAGMSTKDKVALMESMNMPLVYNDSYVQKAVDAVNKTGIKDYKAATQYADGKINALGGTYMLGEKDLALANARAKGDWDEVDRLLGGKSQSILDDIIAKQNLQNQEGSKGGSYGGVVGNGTNNYYNDLMAMFMEQNEAARQSMIDAIFSNLGAVKGEYKQQIQNVIDEYQKLIDENEIARDRTRRRIRENQANRGQLDSGLGRQERLNLDTTYDTNNTNLQAAREKAIAEIQSLIAQAEAEANQNKAQVENNYNNALLEWQMANQ